LLSRRRRAKGRDVPQAVLGSTEDGVDRTLPTGTPGISFSPRTATSAPMKSGRPCPKCGVRGSSVSRASEPATAPSPSATCSRARSPYSPSSKLSPATTAASRNSIGSDHGDESQKAIATGRMRRSDDGELSQSPREGDLHLPQGGDRKSTRLNSSHEWISYAVFC